MRKQSDETMRVLSSIKYLSNYKYLLETTFEQFLGWAPTPMSLFSSIRLSVAHQISGTVHNMFIILSTYVKNDGTFRCVYVFFFIFSKF